MSKRKEPKKSRNMMYEQQIRFLPEGISIDNLYDFVKENLKPKRFAFIVHDEDQTEEHLHLMLQFENERSVMQVAKILGDKPQNIEIWDERVENGFSYLVHATDNSVGKYPYDPKDVIANFDFVEWFEKTSKKVREVKGVSSNAKINALLNQLANGEITLTEAKEELTGVEYGKAAVKLGRVHDLYLERKASQLYEEMKEKGETISVNWIFGDTGTGKTLLAKALAEKEGDYYLSTATTDPLQFYEAEPIIILDELRPDTFPYSEVLAMFDPYNFGRVQMSSRYTNTMLACKKYYVTTPFSPEQFYSRSVRGKLAEIDKPEQLYRRLTSVINMDQEYTHEMKYDPKKGIYVPGRKKKNHYSSKNNKETSTDSLFDEID